MQSFFNSAINIRLIITLIGHLALSALLYCILVYLGIFSLLPNEINYLNWDVAFYRDIKDTGYIYEGAGPSNMAFFPLFPYLWKFIEFSALQIGVFNFAIFAGSFSVLVAKRGLETKYLLVLISIPCFIFFYLPYSESLFFLFGLSIIRGYRDNKFIFVITGILGCCLTRAVSIVFIPVIIVTEILYWKSSKEIFVFPGRRIMICCLLALLAILVVVCLQGIQTEKWFYSLEAAKNFNRALIFPALPFTTLAPERILGIDGVAWSTGLIAIYFCIKWSFCFLRGFLFKRRYMLTDDRSVFFSALFLSSVFLIDTFFTNYLGGHTNLWSIDRHLLCTPFAVHFIVWFVKDCGEERIDLYSLALIIFAGMFITGIYQFQLHLYFYFLFFTAVFLGKYFAKARLLLYPLYAFNLLLAVVFFHDFLSFKWVG